MPKSLASCHLALFVLLYAGTGIADETPNVLTESLQARIDGYHVEGRVNGESLRIVYFHPADAAPQADYEARLTRIMLDIQEFYRTEMRRLGFADRPMPLEMDGPTLKIHTVQGAEPSSAYSYQNGSLVRREIEAALRGVVDFQTDFVLVFGGLCQRREDGEYFFHSPYYGDGSSNHQRGLCYAADCELLDPELLVKTDKRIRFEEHNGDFNKNLAAFNSSYLGGIAHELGHGLSLPHNGQTRDQRGRLGTALMGSGNHTYRNDRWGGGNGSFMTIATCARLAAHPLFTGSDRGRDLPAKSEVTNLDFTSREKQLTIHGSVQSDLEVLAAIAYADPEGHAGYDSLAWVAEVKDGRFQLHAPEHRPGAYDLRLTFLYINGAVSTTSFRYSADAAGVPDSAALNAAWTVQPLEQLFMARQAEEVARRARSLLGKNLQPAVAERLEHLVALAAGQEVLSLGDVDGDFAYLSDVDWLAAEVGWGRPARNQYFTGPGIRDALLLELNGDFHAQGLYAHAPAKYTFDLDGRWKTFRAATGLQAGAMDAGSAVFTVLGDGKPLYTSKLLKGRDVEQVEVNVEGVKTLELITASGKQGNAGCWSIWGSPRVAR